MKFWNEVETIYSKKGTNQIMNIIVYGLGKNGREFIQETKELYKNVKIAAITDTYIQTLDLLPDEQKIYIEAAYIDNYEFDYIVVTPDKHFDEIKNTLIKAGIQEQKVKSLREIGRIIGKYYCNLCGNAVLSWRYIGEEYHIFHGKNIVGASRRRGGCPICGGFDRTRYVYYIIKRYTDLLNGSKHKILHFAPEHMLSEKIRGICKDEYITADIIPGRGDVIADITQLQFEDERFEFIICNHVMEHIKEEEKAFSEMRRCLKSEGVLILTVPVCWEQKTYEDEKIVTEDERIKNYGQKDHVRLYGNDIVGRVEKFGFDVELFLCNEVVDEEDRNKFGFIFGDSVLMCKKRDKADE